MNLSQADVSLFYKLWYELIWSINHKHGIVPKFDKPIYGKPADQQAFFSIRNKMWKNPYWIDDFLSESEFGALNEIERSIISRWRNEFVSGRFLVMQHTSKYTIFMNYDVDIKGANVPKAMAARYAEIAKVIEVYCDLKLTEGYKDVCLEVLAKLARKRPSPLVSGRVGTWACGIVYAVGAYRKFTVAKTSRLLILTRYVI